MIRNIIAAPTIVYRVFAHQLSQKGGETTISRLNILSVHGWLFILLFTNNLYWPCGTLRNMMLLPSKVCQVVSSHSNMQSNSNSCLFAVPNLWQDTSNILLL